MNECEQPCPIFANAMRLCLPGNNYGWVETAFLPYNLVK